VPYDEPDDVPDDVPFEELPVEDEPDEVLFEDDPLLLYEEPLLLDDELLLFDEELLLFDELDLNDDPPPGRATSSGVHSATAAREHTTSSTRSASRAETCPRPPYAPYTRSASSAPPRRATAAPNTDRRFLMTPPRPAAR
jgi:hypothetical protein